MALLYSPKLQPLPGQMKQLSSPVHLSVFGRNDMQPRSQLPAGLAVQQLSSLTQREQQVMVVFTSPAHVELASPEQTWHIKRCNGNTFWLQLLPLHISQASDASHSVELTVNSLKHPRSTWPTKRFLRLTRNFISTEKDFTVVNPGEARLVPGCCTCTAELQGILTDASRFTVRCAYNASIYYNN